MIPEETMVQEPRPMTWKMRIATRNNILRLVSIRARSKPLASMRTLVKVNMIKKASIVKDLIPTQMTIPIKVMIQIRYSLVSISYLSKSSSFKVKVLIKRKKGMRNTMKRKRFMKRRDIQVERCSLTTIALKVVVMETKAVTKTITIDLDQEPIKVINLVLGIQIKEKVATTIVVKTSTDERKRILSIIKLFNYLKCILNNSNIYYQD